MNLEQLVISVSQSPKNLSNKQINYDARGNAWTPVADYPWRERVCVCNREAIVVGRERPRGAPVPGDFHQYDVIPA